MNSIEAIFFWLATLMLAGSFLLSTLALVLGKSAPFRAAHRVYSLAPVPLLGWTIARWVGSGHPPFVTLFESMIFSVFLVVTGFRIGLWRWAGIKAALSPMSGITLLLIGWSLTLPHQASPLSAALDNVWLFIHASFATAGAAVFLIAAALALAYLLGPERVSRLRIPESIRPKFEDLPKKVSTFLLLGFILWGTMIASGAIWANVAWGRYWGWDPIETWSLISWIFYALLMHARITFNLPGRMFCLLTILTAGVVAFSLWGIQYVYKTIHSYG